MKRDTPNTASLNSVNPVRYALQTGAKIALIVHQIVPFIIVRSANVDTLVRNVTSWARGLHFIPIQCPVVRVCAP